MSEITFAQLCKNVSSIEKSESHQVHLYGVTNSETERTISAVDFINCFYSADRHNEGSDIKFSMGEDSTARTLADTKVSLDTWWESKTAAPFEVATSVPNRYATEMCCNVTDFDTCSLMKIRSELLELENIGAACKTHQLVCCSLTLEELSNVVRDANGVAGQMGVIGSLGYDSVNGDGGGIKKVANADAQAAALLPVGTKLCFSVMVTNPSNKVSDIELKLHFKIG